MIRKMIADMFESLSGDLGLMVEQDSGSSVGRPTPVSRGDSEFMKEVARVAFTGITKDGHIVGMPSPFNGPRI